MEMTEVISLCLGVLCSIGFGVMLYYKVKGNVFAVVSELIAVAETTGLTGAEKMDKVVLALYEMVPTVFKSVFTLERLEHIAQYIFDWMRKYADEYRAKVEAKLPEQSEEDIAQAIGIEVTAALIADLLALTLEGLKEKALEYGVDPEGLRTKHDFIEAIVTVMLLSAKEI